MQDAAVGTARSGGAWRAIVKKWTSTVRRCPGTRRDASIRFYYQLQQNVDVHIKLYELAADPHEATNVAHPSNHTIASELARVQMAQILEEQRAQKRLVPTSGESQNVPGCPVAA